MSGQNQKNPTLSKGCSDCKVKKPLLEFQKNKASADGFRSECKICTATRRGSRYNSEIECARSKKWREENPEKHYARVKEWTKKNKHVVNKRRAIKYATNPEVRKKISDYSKKYNSENSEIVAERRRNWQKNNRDKTQSSCNLRYSRKKGATVDSHSIEAERSLRKEMISLAESTGVKYGIDHIFPLAKGGPNHHDNMQILPRSINSQKGDRLNFYDEGIHWTQLKTHVLEMIDPVKLLAAYKEIGKKPPKRIAAHLTGLI